MEIEDAITRLRSQMEDDGSQDDAEIMVRCGDVRAVIQALEDALAAA